MPALATAAAAAAAGLVATKGPDLLKKISGEADEEAEELGGKAAEGAKKKLGASGGLVGKAASRLMGGGGGEGQKGGKTRRLPIQRWTDVAVPIDKAYEAWTKLEEWPELHAPRARGEAGGRGEQDPLCARKSGSRPASGTVRSPSKRKNDRIAWKSVSGTAALGFDHASTSSTTS